MRISCLLSIYDGESQLDDLIKITFDGESIEVRKGITVLEAAEEAGVFIPTLCSDADLHPYGACRLCVVEIDGVRGYPTACTTTATDGMVVRTDTPDLTRLRRATIQLIRSDHPTDCDACPRNQQCDLQMTEAILEAAKPRFQSLGKDLPVDRSNPFFNINRNYCVLCGKCVRSCSEIRGVNAINLSNRGYQTKVSTAVGSLIIESNCESCGECLDHCPVYALNPKDTRKPSEEIESICPYCGVGCAINLGVRQGEIVSSIGNREGGANKGRLCVKGRFGIPEFVHHPDRVKTPLIKRNGELVKASWDEALNLVADKLKAYQGNEVSVISSAKCTNEDNYIFQKFSRVALGTNNIDNQARLYMSPSNAGLTRSLGMGVMTNPIEEINGSSCILVIDNDTTVTHPIVGLKIKNAVNNGAKLLVINFRETNLLRIASTWMQPKIGTSVALLIGMMRVIVDEGLSNSAFITERTANFEALKKSLDAFSLDAVEKITGVPANQIAEAARIYAGSDRSSIIYNTDFIRNTIGTNGAQAVANLALLTGNIGRPSSGIYPLSAQNNAQGACDMGSMPDVYPGYQPVDDPSIQAKFEAAWGCSLSNSKGMNYSESLEAAAKKNIKAMYIIGSNPLLTESASQVKESLASLEFLVVQDIFLTETVKMADVVLPAASFAEKDGTFTNTERRVQRIRKAIDPIGESKPDWWITCQLGQKMGKAGFTFSYVSRIMDEIASLTPAYHGISYNRLDNGSLQWPCPDNKSNGTPVLYTDTFNGNPGKFMPLEFTAPAIPTDAKYPFMLVTGRSLYFTQTGTVSRKVSGLKTLRGEDTVEVSTKDAQNLQITDGECVKVISPHGEVSAKAQLCNRLLPGTVFMEFPSANGQMSLITTPAIDSEFRIPKYVPCTVRIEKQVQ
jgi:formate dehydrogenase alpha subunit